MMRLGNNIMRKPHIFTDPKYLFVTSETRLLVAMADPKTRLELQAYFENVGQEVKVTGQVDKIVSVARLWQPHVILISDDFETKPVEEICQDLLADTRTNHIPMILLCRDNDKLTRLHILEMGVSDIITRPLDLEELRWRIAAVRRWSTIPKL